MYSSKDRLSRWISFSWIQLAFLALHLCNVCGFNVDIGLSKVISGPAHSYFGYTVGLMKVNDVPRLVVGAPKSNTTFRPEWREPGAVYICTMGRSPTCSELSMGETGDETLEGVHGQWLGSSLDIWTSKSGRFNKILACAPLWKNTRFQDTYLVQGRCHEVGYGSDVTFQEVYQPLKSRKSPLEQVTENNVYLKAMGQAGISAEFSQDNNALIVGAPGMFNWRGGVAFIKNDSRPCCRPYWLEDDISGDMYAGYSVTSGRFFSDRMIYSVTGIPRWLHKGKIIIFEENFRNIITEIEGDQFGSYFGASLCVANINGDPYDDLLVGAPLYSDDHEEGRVYAYISLGLSAIVPNVVLRGPNKPGSRFGSAISGIGDIDNDGFNDIAVGAPFADDMRGAVYIYHGDHSGLNDMYAQEILGKKVHSGLRGFGWSFSKPLDIDNNEYQDFATGAFLSDEVVVLKTRPVAKVYASIQLEREVINLLERSCFYNGRSHSCIQVEITFLYTGNYVPDSIEIEFELLADTRPDDNYEVGRAQFLGENNRLNTVIYRRILLTIGEEKRLWFMAIIKPKLDKFTDIVFELRFNKTEFCQPGLTSNKCPLLDVKLPTYLRRFVSFRKECDSKRGCISDLKLQASSPKSLLVGGTSYMTVKVVVTNRGEAAYLSKVHVRCQADIKVASVDTIEVPRDNHEGITDIRCFTDTSKTDEDQKEASMTLLECDVGNPLRTGNSVVFLVKFDVRELVPLGPFTTIELNAETKSQEMYVTLHDNFKELNISLHREVHLRTRGISRPEQLTYRQQKTKQERQLETKPRLIHLEHAYWIVNSGKSMVPNITMKVDVPVKSKDGIPLLLISSVEILAPEGQTQDISGGCQTLHLPGLYDENGTMAMIGQVVEDGDSLPLASGRFRNMYLNCSSAECITVSCVVRMFRPGSTAVLTVRSRVSENALLQLKARGVISLQTNASFTVENDAILSTSSNTNSTVLITTEIYPHVFTSPRIGNWIVVVCGAAGILLLMLICIILWRVGFFRRTKQEELQRLINGSALTRSDSGRGTNSTSTENEAAIPEDVSSAAGNTDSEPPDTPRYDDDVDDDTLTRSTTRETKSFVFDRPDRAFSNLTYDEATRFGTRV